MHVFRPEPREEQGTQGEQEQEGWGGKILAPVELPDITA